MPNRAARRGGDLEQMALSVTCGGNRYDIDINDISALDERDYYEATGQTFMDVFSGRFSSFAIAGLVWVYRRRWERKLTFEEVLREFKMSDLESLSFGDEDEEDEAEVPEPAYDGKNPERSGEPSAPPSLGSPLSTVSDGRTS